MPRATGLIQRGGAARRTLLAAAALTLSATLVLAQEVTLTARDGALALTGRLLGFDGEIYRIETDYGELSLDGTGVSCAGAACPDPDAFVAELRISGSAAVGRAILPALLETFAVRNRLRLVREDGEGDAFVYSLRDRGDDTLLGVFDFALSTSAEGFADLIADEADLVISRREIDGTEVALARQAGRGDLREPGRSRILALDGIVPAVAIQNPVAAMQVEDLRAIVDGRITDWSEVGGDPGPIELHVTDPEGALFRTFRTKLLNDAVIELPPGTVIHASAAALAAATQDEPRALGLASFSELGDAQPVDLLGACGRRAQADVLSLKAEDYPLTAPVFLYAPARRLAPLARDFVAYANSPAAQPVIRRAGFVDQFPQAIPVADQGVRLSNAIRNAGAEVSLRDLKTLVGVMEDSVRLSLSFRFENGSSELDAQSRSNVKLLAEALDRGVFDGRTLIFAGFSDGQGPASTNLRLSRARASVVRDAVRRTVRNLDPTRVDLETEAFGEALPMACDGTDWSRRVNRRVEVWLR